MKPLLLLFCLCFATALSAQESRPPDTTAGTRGFNTLFGKGSGGTTPQPGFFAELNGGYTRFGGRNVFLPGISLGVILSHHWTIGLSGSFIGNLKGLYYHNIYFDSTANRKHGANLNGGFGAVLLEYTLHPKARVHFAFPLLIGIGDLYYTHQSHHNDSTISHHDWKPGNVIKDHFFFLEPGVRVEANMIRALRIGLGISYRYAPNLDLRNTPANLVNQFTATLRLRFGRF